MVLLTVCSAWSTVGLAYPHNEHLSPLTEVTNDDVALQIGKVRASIGKETVSTINGYFNFVGYHSFALLCAAVKCIAMVWPLF